MPDPVQDILQFFKYEHLREGVVRDTAKAFADFADAVVARTRVQNAELAMCLRKLLEAKDAGVRAQL